MCLKRLKRMVLCFLFKINIKNMVNTSKFKLFYEFNDPDGSNVINNPTFSSIGQNFNHIKRLYNVVR